MELGNMCFGHSRGEYPIERSGEFEFELYRLFGSYDDTQDYYGPEFENDIFHVFPYYWGDCTCGYDDKEWAWGGVNKHDPGCYQHDYIKSRVCDLDKHEKWLKNILKPLYIKHGFPTTGENWWFGCALGCTCDYGARRDKFLAENSHSTDCPIIRPNFLYKPTNFSIMWYKYPLRDSYMSYDITIKEFRKIINDCIKSLQ